VKKFIVISGICCVGTCRRVSVVAEKFPSGGWITKCDKHAGQPITLDGKALDKIIAADKMDKQVQTRS
jgi:hypothetical protein